jgi:signal transduction histidine kinase
MFVGTDRRSQSLTRVNRGQATEKGRIYQLEPTELRGLAEAQLSAKTLEGQLSRSHQHTERIIRETKLRQIELEMQHAEASLARDEDDAALEQYRDLYDFAPVGYLTIDREGAIRTANLTGASLLDIEHSRLLGRHFEWFVAAEARPAFAQFLGEVFSTPARVTCEVVLLKAGELPFFAQIQAVVDASGQLCRAVLIDISPRRQIELDQGVEHAELASRVAKLEHANLELEEANSELEAFNYTVAHDLCNPLTSINSYAQLLMRTCRDQLDEQSREQLRRISASIMRMKGLIASLLDFSRVAYLGVNRKQFNLSAIAHAVAAGLSAAQTESRVTFRCAEGIMCNGDEALCRIILENLLGNAWKYTANRPATVIEFGMSELGGEPVFFVCDNGPGFDMAQAGKLFAPFQRISKEDPGGHGIGLATVKRIVRRHDGRVWAESSPGEGATFFFTLA